MSTFQISRTTEPDFEGLSFYVGAGRGFDVGHYCDAYNLPRDNFAAEDVQVVQDAAESLAEGEWLEVAHDQNPLLIDEILAEKSKLDNGYLWLHSTGDCILWPDKESCVNDDGARAVERWQLTREGADALVETGAVDERA